MLILMLFSYLRVLPNTFFKGVNELVCNSFKGFFYFCLNVLLNVLLSFCLDVLLNVLLSFCLDVLLNILLNVLMSCLISCLMCLMSCLMSCLKFSYFYRRQIIFCRRYYLIIWFNYTPKLLCLTAQLIAFSLNYLFLARALSQLIISCIN